MRIPVTTLNDGYDFPLLGLGTYKLTGDEVETIVRTAIELGYRHIDTAALYDNEVEVGKAINNAIKAGDVTREELFVTTKLWNDDQERVAEAYKESLQRLNLDFVDLYLVHWPWPQHGTYVQAFEQITQLQGMGQLQSVGVANFYPEVLDEIIQATGITPVLNQVELHAGFTQPELRAYHDKHGIVTEAWAPIARGSNFDDPVIRAVADAHEATPAQVSLAYLMKLGCSVVPKTSSPQRLVENLGAVDLELSDDDVAALDGVTGERLSGDPLTFPG
ncbi:MULTISPECIES: aldo/keto reductase [Corynebacterium]|uniref:Aldo/keto reductase n=2 Tax=Corynebacterium TaxID=1716 RepID=A0A077HHH2_9CORY|nr:MULTISPECIES: aldo/keto reductase [Corynebacterium]AIL96473.1 aldo/keto reductase [Corynebacterium ureicelerivorans]MDN8627264.1 aldo/keto reductase [Corynebacterium ureicelerivorans]NKY67795.1 aldo/keto reductase [Corynebacterium mucifaciens]